MKRKVHQWFWRNSNYPDSSSYPGFPCIRLLARYKRSDGTGGSNSTCSGLRIGVRLFSLKFTFNREHSQVVGWRNCNLCMDVSFWKGVVKWYAANRLVWLKIINSMNCWTVYLRECSILPTKHSTQVYRIISRTWWQNSTSFAWTVHPLNFNEMPGKCWLSCGWCNGTKHNHICAHPHSQYSTVKTRTLRYTNVRRSEWQL